MILNKTDADGRCHWCQHAEEDGHDKSCPSLDENFEVWQTGYESGKSHEDFDGEVGSTHWLGWVKGATE